MNQLNLMVIRTLERGCHIGPNSRHASAEAPLLARRFRELEARKDDKPRLVALSPTALGNAYIVCVWRSDFSAAAK